MIIYCTIGIKHFGKLTSSKTVLTVK